MCISASFDHQHRANTLPTSLPQTSNLTMLCLRCMRGAFAPSKPVTSALRQVQQLPQRTRAQPQPQSR